MEDSRHEAVLHLANAASGIRFIPDYKGASTRGTLIELRIERKIVLSRNDFFEGENSICALNAF